MKYKEVIYKNESFNIIRNGLATEYTEKI